MATTYSYQDLKPVNRYQAMSADTTLTAADSGKTFLMAATGKAIILPAVKAGVFFKFLCKTTTASTNWTVGTASGANVIFGSAQVAGAVVAADAEDLITLVVAKYLPGDWVSVECDGTNWYVEGSVVTAAGVTFTVT